jgi:pyrroloquinoline-quinone synthase
VSANAGAAQETLSPQAFEARLRRIGAERYHHLHPFNARMHAGTLTPGEIRTWVANRYYYQTRIPIKDGLILSKAQDPAFRRAWISRIHDHDGTRPGEGGLALWLALADAVGLERARVESLRDVLPGVRRACDAYVELVASSEVLPAVASSLTELFAGDIMAVRIAAFEKHYPWVRTEGLAYFRTRTRQAPADAAFGLDFVLREARTREAQERCIAALLRKCEILWALLDAVEASGERLRLSRHAQPRLTDAEPLVVLPERALRLTGSGPEVLSLCDGQRSAAEIAEAMRARHPEASGAWDDAHDFLAAMKREGVLTCAPR